MVLTTEACSCVLTGVVFVAITSNGTLYTDYVYTNTSTNMKILSLTHTHTIDPRYHAHKERKKVDIINK